MNKLSPLYTAVMEWVAALKLLVVNFAVPLVSAIVPRVVGPSLKVTDPVGDPLVELAEALNVTDCPESEGFSDELIVTEGVSLPISVTKP